MTCSLATHSPRMLGGKWARPAASLHILHDQLGCPEPETHHIFGSPGLPPITVLWVAIKWACVGTSR